jgi:hypothetical protein
LRKSQTVFIMTAPFYILRSSVPEFHFLHTLSPTLAIFCLFYSYHHNVCEVVMVHIFSHTSLFLSSI